jgi:hypothetical protein
MIYWDACILVTELVSALTGMEDTSTVLKLLGG